MAVTATATLVATFAGDAARPPGHAGWNNPVGDPLWIPDVDWYRRVQLTCTGGANEDTRIVNWECYDDTLLFKTTAALGSDASFTGTSATHWGASVNNSTTWTVWASNGSTTASTIKYYDTKTPCISKYRANGQRVQVILGNRKKVGVASTAWTIAAFLPGAGKLPTATANITVAAPGTVLVGGYAALPGGDEGDEEELRAIERSAGEDVEEEPEEVEPQEEEAEEPEYLVEADEEPVGPDTSWTKAEIIDWLANQGVEAEHGSNKRELLDLADSVLSGEGK